VFGCILWRYIYAGKLFSGLKIRNLCFLIEHFVEKQFCRVVLFQIHFGPGAARIRTDVFHIRILLTVPAPTGSATLVRGVPVVPEVNWMLKGASIWMMFVSWLTLLRAVVPAPFITSLNEWHPLNNKPEPITLRKMM
jgi:hypothetical protein